VDRQPYTYYLKLLFKVIIKSLRYRKTDSITHTLVVKRASGIRIIFEFLEVDFVVDDGLVLVVHGDRFPGELDLVVADEQSVEVGHGARQFVDA
jgi:hypothetical protein